MQGQEPRPEDVPEPVTFPDAQNPSELAEMIVWAQRHLNAMTPEWWRRHHSPPPSFDPHPGILVVGHSIEFSAIVYRNDAAATYADQFRVLAMKLWGPGMPTPPPRNDGGNSENDLAMLWEW